MWQVALKMLVGDRSKYLGLVFGIMFATFLMSQQISIFIGIMSRTASQISDVIEADIWVMDPQVQYYDEIKPLPDRALIQTRSVEGVEWAVPMFKGLAVARAEGGVMQQIILIGVDDATLVGQPPVMIAGEWLSLKQPDALIIDRAGHEFMWPGEPIELGRILEINDQRAVISAVADPSPPFLTFPVVFTRYSKAMQLVPGERNRLTFVLAKAAPGQDPTTLARNISEQTGFQALTQREFIWRSVHYYLTRTGIPVNFGITITLGFVIGAVIAGQTFFLFVIENLRQFGALKAIGVTNGQILRMVLLQAMTVAFLGFSLGIGLCAIFFTATAQITALRGLLLEWYVMAGTGAAIVVIIILASIMSIRKVMVLDPASVFRG